MKKNVDRNFVGREILFSSMRIFILKNHMGLVFLKMEFPTFFEYPRDLVYGMAIFQQ